MELLVYAVAIFYAAADQGCHFLGGLIGERARSLVLGESWGAELDQAVD